MMASIVAMVVLAYLVAFFAVHAVYGFSSKWTVTEQAAAVAFWPVILFCAVLIGVYRLSVRAIDNLDEDEAEQ